jgi:hypothetical protein
MSLATTRRACHDSHPTNATLTVGLAVLGEVGDRAAQESLGFLSPAQIIQLHEIAGRGLTEICQGPTALPAPRRFSVS